jgi:hypothetical protein
MEPSQNVDAIRFGALAASIQRSAGRFGLHSPSYRSPSRRPGMNRSMRRYPDGSVRVAVNTRSRLFDDVAADMVDGLFAANGLDAQQNSVVRTAILNDARTALVPAA